MPIRQTIVFFQLLFGIVLLLTIWSCSHTKPEKVFRVGFSQCVESDAWRQTMLQEMKRELSFHPNIKFIYRQAGGNSQTQIQQVEDLLNQNIDLLIISPNEADPLTPVVEKTFNRNISVIVVDRKISTPYYSAYVGGDNYEVGKMAGQYAANLLNGKGSILEITGLPKSSPAIERHKGFADAIRTYPSMHIFEQVNGQWLKDTAQKEVSKIDNQLKNVGLVFAQNDQMALGTYEVFHRRQSNMPYIIGVDGLASRGAGLDLVTNKIITATMLYPTGGEEAIRIAVKILNKQPYEKENLLQTTVIDSANVRIMQLQAAKAGSQQEQIERQQAKLTEQQRIYNNQRTLLYILVLSLVLLIILGGLALYSLRENRKINKKLLWQNLEINEQKSQLEIMSAQAKAANEAKVNFFTNISHEFRTPLTLILGPLEDLLANSKNNFVTNQSLSMIQKNVIRLLRLVNQLIDFRKIELDKMKVSASEEDLVTFTQEIVNSYKSIAQKRHIDLRLITNEHKIILWIDTTMMDKVIFNLLSNAFKFTKDDGYIHVYLGKNEKTNEATIKVEDNGIGMSEDALKHAFEIFYQGDKENYKGSGLGLALSKELIQLHKGSIFVNSEKGKGTSFVICLPLGEAHLEEAEKVKRPLKTSTNDRQEIIYNSYLETKTADSDENEASAGGKEHSILIIEDNEDLRKFLASRLKSKYEILEAENSQVALQQAFDTVPDLILCDVVIPGQDGIALTNIFKNDIRTSHIPVILLTAKTSVEQQIEGIKSKADAYITKPFNVTFLEQSIKSMLENRARLKDHFTSELSSNLRTQLIGKPDRKFISEFSALVESNLSNEEFDITNICQAMGISRVQLYRKVKALLNINVNDYILNTRLAKAKYLLQHEDLTISEVSYKVGFSSPAYFSTVFKSKFGVTPRAYKGS